MCPNRAGVDLDGIEQGGALWREADVHPLILFYGWRSPYSVRRHEDAERMGERLKREVDICRLIVG